MLKKIFGKHFNVFNVFTDIGDNFIEITFQIISRSLHWAGPAHKRKKKLVVWLFVCSHAVHDVTVTAMFCLGAFIKYEHPFF